MTSALTLLQRALWRLRFRGSRAYWDARYRAGGNSGCGSYGPLAIFKAEVLNDFFAKHDVNSVIEFGCGDGHQLGMLRVATYRGLDVSPAVIARCRAAYADDTGKSFEVVDDYDGDLADCALSLDVLYHLVEDRVFDEYMTRLFKAAKRYVLIYSTNEDGQSGGGLHIRHRVFTDWVAANAPEWVGVERVPNRYPDLSRADFYIYVRGDSRS